MSLEVHQFACLSDNYGFLIRDEATGKTACRKNPKTGKYTICDRYLPEKAWSRLTKGQQQSTRAKKKRARRQYVPNAPSAKRAGQRARKEPLR